MKAKPRDKVKLVSSMDGLHLEDITPERAADLLSQKASNRSLSETMVARYASDIAMGRWKVTGDTVKIDKKGKLIDGQHRLAAVIAAGIPIKTYVVYGIESAAMDVMDSGKKRTPGDMLHILGYKSTHRLAAIARWLITIKYDLTNTKTRSFKPTNTEIRDIVERHPGLQDTCRHVEGAKGVTQSLLGAVHYIGSAILDDTETADAFYAAGESGSELGFYTLDLLCGRSFSQKSK